MTWPGVVTEALNEDVSFDSYQLSHQIILTEYGVGLAGTVTLLMPLQLGHAPDPVATTVVPRLMVHFACASSSPGQGEPLQSLLPQTRRSPPTRETVKVALFSGSMFPVQSSDQKVSEQTPLVVGMTTLVPERTGPSLRRKKVAFTR